MNNPSAPIVDTRSAEHCRRVLATLPVTNVPQAHQILIALLKDMYQVPPAPLDYLGILEAARESVDIVQEAAAARYAAKPLPATEDESATFERVNVLWRLMADSYGRVAQLGGGDPAIKEQLALVCQRCILYAGCSIIECYRAHRSVSPGRWLDLHGYYDTAEEWGLASQVVVSGFGDGSGYASCTATYAAVLLVDLANPYSRTSRELGLIIRWARMMAANTAIVRSDVEAGSRGYGIDLMQDKGLLPVDQLAAASSARLFDTSRLGERMQSVLADLKVGQSPAALGLGDCPKAQASRLLLHLYRPWCLAAMPRRFERKEAKGTLALAYDLDAIYFHIAGHDFTQPAHVRTFSRSEVETMCTFGTMVESVQPIAVQTAQRDHALDMWDISDQSSNGYRLFRQADGPRVEHGQLLAIRAPGAKRFVLGRVTWLMLEADGRLQAGIQVLPHPAAGVAVRPTGLSIAASEKYTRAFFLPAVAALKEPISVVLPSGWFSPGRIIEVYTDRQVTVRLGELMVQGSNFERCTFTLVS